MEEDHRRRDDVIIAALSQKLTDFIDRYERDYRLALEKDKQDYEHTMRWRNQMDAIQKEQSDQLATIVPAHLEMAQRLKINSEILSDIGPNYKRGMWIVSIIFIACVGASIKMIFDRVVFR